MACLSTKDYHLSMYVKIITLYPINGKSNKNQTTVTQSNLELQTIE